MSFRGCGDRRFVSSSAIAVMVVREREREREGGRVDPTGTEEIKVSDATVLSH